MENNSPYVYEKPIRAKGSKRNKGFAALGLVALGSAIGTGAFANMQVTQDVASSKQQSSDQSSSKPIESADPNSIVSVSFAQSEPKKSVAAISLPAVQFQDYGNTSSATPSAGSGSNNSGAYQDSDDHDDRHDDDEDDD